MLSGLVGRIKFTCRAFSTLPPVCLPSRKNKVVPAQIQDIQAVMLENLHASRGGTGELPAPEQDIPDNQAGVCLAACMHLHTCPCSPARMQSGRHMQLVRRIGLGAMLGACLVDPHTYNSM